MEWNRAVDRAIVSGVPEAEILELKKTEITDKARESVERNGRKPELFGSIVKAAVALLELLIAKALRAVMEIAEKAVKAAADAKETPEEAESRIPAKDEPEVRAERKKIPLPINPNWKTGVQSKAEPPQQKNTITVKKAVIEQMKEEQKPVPAETKRLETERQPQPKPTVLASKYPRLKEIDNRLKEQNKAIFAREKQRDRLKKDLAECTGIFKSGRRKELQQEIDGIEMQISNMKKRLSSIVKEYRFDSVQAFYRELNAASKEHLAYKVACAEWEKTYGEKMTDSMSIKERLRQKEQIVKEREASRMHRERQKDQGAR